MPRGRKTSFTIHLTPAERQTLLAWQRSTTISAGLARRGRIILLLADGVTITDIAATVGMSRHNMYKWIQRFLQEGVEGLTRQTEGAPERAAFPIGKIRRRGYGFLAGFFRSLGLSFHITVKNYQP